MFFRNATRLKVSLFTLIVLFYAHAGWAQTPSSAVSGANSAQPPKMVTPSSSNDLVLPLIVETSRKESASGIPSEIVQNYWWGGDKSPLWTATDKQLAAISNQLVRPTDLSQLSVIFKTPNLTVSNAASLGKMFGAGQVLLGTLQRTTYAEKPLGESLQSFQFEGVLLKVSGDHPQLQREFSIRRTFLGDSPDHLNKVRKQILETVADAFYKETTNRSPDIYQTKSTSNLTVALRNMGSIVDLQEVIHALESRKDIKSANIGWVSDHIITLDLVPEKNDSNGLSFEDISNFLGNSRFQSFRLEISPDATNNQVIIANRVPLPVENFGE